MTKKEVAEYLRISEKTVERYCRKGQLRPTFKYKQGSGRTLDFDRQAVERFKIAFYTPVDCQPKEVKTVLSKQTWVYLMKDLRNGFYKIGQSQNPQYRERTLQSEQPLIALVEAWVFVLPLARRGKMNT
jgi:excisionase family DNA binding protein